VSDAILKALENVTEKLRSENKDFVRWEELPAVVRALIKSRYSYQISGISLGALYSLIQEYRRELEAKELPEIEMPEEYNQAVREGIKEIDMRYKEYSKIGSDDYWEMIDEIANMIATIGEDAIKPGEIADMIMQYIHFATMSDTEELYIYQEGVYKPLGEAFVKRFLQDLFKKMGLLRRLSTYFVNEVINHIKRSTLHNRSEFDRDIYIINVKNGLLDIRNMQLYPHDPKYLSVIQLPVEWNPNAKCERWDQFIKEIVEEEDAKVLQEFVGYLLLRDCRFQKALLLVG
jgi:hypothetical protein